MTDAPIRIEQRGGIAIVVLADPGGGNRMTPSAIRSLADACARVADDGDIRVAVLTGMAGVFATGIVPLDAERPLPRPASLVAAIRKPVVAAIDGDCLDQGLELALACDVRIAARGARFGIRHVAQGMLPWDGGTQRLTRAVGRAHALRLLLLADTIGVDEALALGLVEAAFEPPDLPAEALAFAERMARAAPIAAAYAKEAVSSGAEMPLPQGLRLEADLSVLLQSTADRAEGLAGFAQRRAPRFEGR